MVVAACLARVPSNLVSKHLHAYFLLSENLQLVTHLNPVVIKWADSTCQARLSLKESQGFRAPAALFCARIEEINLAWN